MNREALEINPVSQTRTGSRTLFRSIRVSLAVLALSASALLPLALETPVALAAEIPQRGDLNGNGIRDRNDLSMLERLVKAWKNYESRPQRGNADPGHYWLVADVNGDRSIDRKDVQALKEILRNKK